MIRQILLFTVLLLPANFLKAQTGYSCAAAIPLTVQTAQYCSGPAAFNNQTQTGVTWFMFAAQSSNVTVIVKGNSPYGTLQQPQITMYTDCAGTVLQGTGGTDNNITTFTGINMVVGTFYYIAVTAQNNATGSFQLCINSSNLPLTNVTCAKAIYVCDTNSFRTIVPQSGLSGQVSGDGCALDLAYSNWYKWTAANNGTLVFTLTPDAHQDDIDFTLYDLGNDDCDKAIEVRCASGAGVNPQSENSSDTPYYKTGLSFTATDVSEPSGYGHGQDGEVQYITMTAGHTYALLISNATQGGDGVTVSFTDKNGAPGTGLFAPVMPMPVIIAKPAATCGTYTFSTENGYLYGLNWDFGPGSMLTDVDYDGNYTVAYSTTGNKTISLTATSSSGCASSTAIALSVPIISASAVPAININKTIFCIGDTLLLTTPVQNGLVYKWTGPDNFTSAQDSVQIVIKNNSQAGTYYLTVGSGPCSSPADSVIILPNFYARPQAAFYAKPDIRSELSLPATIKLFNQSTNADNYLWDFGDGATSVVSGPSHTYTATGTYKVTLTAFQNTACSTSVIEGDLVIVPKGSIFIPNTFTPNGDGINDTFVTSLANIQTFKIQIFNRYGLLVYVSQDQFTNWDGNYKNTKVPDGTYYYLIDATDLGNNPIKLSGSITIIR